METSIGVVSMSFQTLRARFGSITKKEDGSLTCSIGLSCIRSASFRHATRVFLYGSFFLCFDGLRVKKCIETPLHDASLGLHILRVLRLLHIHISFSDRQARRIDPDPKVDQTYLLRGHCGLDICSRISCLESTLSIVQVRCSCT